MSPIKNAKKLLLIFLVIITSLNLSAQYINPGLVLTFDDYSIQNWHKLIPILEKYNAKATFFICYPYTFDSIERQMILDLKAAGNEIGSHGYYHYNCVNYTDTSTVDSYITNEILPSINWFDTVLNIPLRSFAYPYGARSAKIDVELLKYFKIIRGTNYSITSSANKITNLSHSRIVSGVGIDDSYNYSLSSIKNNLSKCMSDSVIQVFYSHRPVDSVVGNYQISYTTLDSILSYASQIGLSFYTISDAWLPVAPAPQGDTLINETTQSSLYITHKNNYEINWKLTPAASGKLYSNDSTTTVEWNSNFVGDITLQAAYKNSCGQGDFSQFLKISQNNLNKISEIPTTAISIYPNPSQGKISIYASDNFKKSVEVYNISGQLVNKTSLSGTILSLNINKKGIYIARIISRNTAYSQTFVIE